MFNIEIEKFKKGHLVPVVLVLSIGIAVGWLSFLLAGDFVGNSKVLYVSREELLTLEKERIAEVTARSNAVDAGSAIGAGNNGDSENQIISSRKEQSIFLGQTTRALQLMDKIARKYQSKVSRVIFVNDQLVGGRGVSSISQAVYAELMLELQANKSLAAQQRSED